MRFHAHTRGPERRRKGWIARLKEVAANRREKWSRLATQAVIYGAGLLMFLAIIYAIIQYT